MSESLSDLYCANHPNIATQLRCNRCDKPICVRCAVSTPTGYRCKECIRGQQKTFETVVWYDYILAIIISAVLAFAGSQLIPRLGFFTIFLSPIAGVAIAEVVRFAIRRRRSLRLFLITTVAAALGGLIPVLFYLIPAIIIFSSGGSVGGFRVLFSAIWQVVYVVIITSTVYYRLSGIRL